jgi:hypothetical protein
VHETLSPSVYLLEKRFQKWPSKFGLLNHNELTLWISLTPARVAQGKGDSISRSDEAFEKFAAEYIYAMKSMSIEFMGSGPT